MTIYIASPRSLFELGLYTVFILFAGIDIGIAIHKHYLLYRLTHRCNEYFDHLVNELRKRAKK